MLMRPLPHIVLPLFFLLLTGKLLHLAAQSTGQSPVLQIHEIRKGSTKGKTEALAAVGKPIVDINSELEIRIDSLALRRAIDEQIPEMRRQSELLSQETALRQSLQNQDRIYAILSETLRTSQIADSTRNEVLLLLVDLLQNINRNPELQEQVSGYFRDFRRAYPRKTREEFYLYLMGRLQEDLEKLSAEIELLRQQSGVRFSLTARKFDRAGAPRRVHVEGFDSLDNGEFFKVNRWVFRLSPEQQEQLEEMGQLTQSLNASTRSVFGNWLQVAKVRAPSLAVIIDLPQKLDTLLTSFEGEMVPEARTLLKEKFLEAQELSRTAELLQQKIGEWSITAPFDAAAGLAELPPKLKEFIESTENDVIARFQQTEFGIRLMGNIAQVKSIMITVQELTDASMQARQAQSDHLVNDRLSEKILAFDLNKIPASGKIELQRTGRREVNDELVVDAYITRDTSADGSRGAPLLIDRREITMILAGAHSYTKLGLILANPYNYELPSTFKQSFLFSPAAALLLKFGSRRSQFYNNFLDWGIGLNTAAPDFDADGTPEFSAGVVTTLFRDILSFGWNWNFGVNTPNYFIGIHLPFNLPGLPVNNVTSVRE